MQKKEKATLSKSSINTFLSVGKIVANFGLKGDLKIASSGDALLSIKNNSSIFIEIHDSFKEYEIEKIHKYKNIFLLKLKNFDSIEATEFLLQKEIFYSKEKLDKFLKKNEHYVYQLIGLNPKFEGNVLKDYAVAEIMDNPAHPILIFKNEENEILIPYLKVFLGEIDLENKTIEVFNWSDWFLED